MYQAHTVQSTCYIYSIHTHIWYDVQYIKCIYIYIDVYMYICSKFGESNTQKTLYIRICRWIRQSAFVEQHSFPSWWGCTRLTNRMYLYQIEGLTWWTVMARSARNAAFSVRVGPSSECYFQNVFENTTVSK